jgi:hypothetical protein
MNALDEPRKTPEAEWFAGDHMDSVAGKAECSDSFTGR